MATKGQFWRTVAAKTIMFFAINVAVFTALACIVVVGGCASSNLYEITDEEYFEESDEECLYYSMIQQTHYLLSGENASLDGMEIEVTNGAGEVIAATGGFEQAKAETPEFVHTYAADLLYDSEGNFKGMQLSPIEEGDRLVAATITAYADPADFTAHSEFNRAVIHLLYSMRYAAFPLAVVCFILGIACYISLICAAGRKPGTDDVVTGPLYRVPFDVLAFVTLFCCMMLYIPIRLSENMVQVFFFCAATFCLVNAVLGLTMSLAARVKRHELIKGTLVYKVLALIVKAFRAIPMVARTIVILLWIAFVEFIYILLNHGDSSRLIIGWILAKVILYPVILYIAYMMSRLKTAGSKLASGDITTPVDTKGFVLDFKQHAVNLNKVSDSVGLAVDERLKSERMKTELITNVSHDIKTPLTSIINYASLMGTCDPADPKMREYSEVVVRQSDKLKRLIEDLVEASKASSGNLEIVPAPLNCCTFVSQTAGEYKERIDGAGLTLVATAPSEPVMIMADGRRMMRIYDNLMNNICKYAQPGTRVYLTLSVEDGSAVTVFKNTSAAELNISADELVERFVRGDRSRNTEGNGLGLSIAKSMTELQGGKFEIDVDGDLFKVTLTFPVVESGGEGDSTDSTPAVAADTAGTDDTNDTATDGTGAETVPTKTDVVSAATQVAEETSSGADSGIAAGVAASVAAAVAESAPEPDPDSPSES
ncbi:MAG: HAMP domain-containing histidine kinase [Clostridiales bacterium]|nr:HAMP domain-containing histidine kinase [Clostridiales bacterium]